MSFREQMSQIRREYRKEADRLDQKIDILANKMDQGMGVVQERLGGAETAIGNVEIALGKVEETVRQVQLQLQTTRDELAATNEAVGFVRGDLRETTRTLQGRARLTEERFGRMLDLVETRVENGPTMEHIHRIEERLRALESKDDPAA